MIKNLFFFLFTFSVLAVSAQPFSLLKDINTDTVQTFLSPASITNVNGTAFFTAKLSNTGIELWKSDGTDAGTVLVRDINMGTSSSNINNLTIVNSNLFFTATDGSSGVELWKSDGTAAGTVLVKDIQPGSASGNAANLIQLNGLLYFTANDGVNGVELWKSDGTSAGTVLLKDINPGGNSSPSSLTVMNGKLYFAANDGVNGVELWASDGTESGTILFKDINAGSGSSSPSALANINNTLYFAANDGTTGIEVWTSDGTVAGTLLFKDINAGTASSAPAYFTASGSSIFFRANNGASGNELFKTDGTEAGTVLVKDIFPGSYPGLRAPFPLLTDLNGILFFVAMDNMSNGIELWKSDGTATGTVMVKNLSSYTPIMSVYNSLTVYNGALFFTVNGTATGQELYSSDGTAAGTVVVKDIRPGSYGSNANSLCVLNGLLYFSADDGVKGQELWKTDGTEAGTSIVKDYMSGKGSSLEDFTTIGNITYFRADDGVNGYELWRTDGTAPGTFMVKDIHEGLYSGTTYPNSSSPEGFTNVNGTLFFVARTATGLDLWKSDGTAAGTVMVKDFIAGEIFQFPVNVNGTLFFSIGESGLGQELWKSDGTAAGTVLVKDISTGTWAPSGQPLSSQPFYLTTLNNVVYFSAGVDINDRGLYRSDGTAAGTFRVLETNPTGGDNVNWLYVFNGNLYFSATDGVHGWEWWKSDGTAAGTGMLKDIAPGLAASNPHYLVEVNGTAFFVADDGNTGYALWKTDGTEAGTVMVKDMVPAGNSSSPLLLGNLNGQLLFYVDNGVDGTELWKSDGTSAGTVMVKDIFPGSGSSMHHSTSVFSVIGPYAYFTADDGVSGLALWRTDGTAAGTKLLQNFSGAGGSTINQIFKLGNKIIVSVTTNEYGTELWSADENIILPLDLVKFDVKLVSGDAHLSWTSENEVNTREFIIERSLDSRTFTPIGIVSARNTDGRNLYHHNDPRVASLFTKVIYYRLKQVDLDGQFTYSKILALSLNEKNNLMVYPNPANTMINFQTTGNKETIIIQDASGRIVKTILTSGTKIVSVNVSSLSTGVYFVKCGNESLKFFKN